MGKLALSKLQHETSGFVGARGHFGADGVDDGRLFAVKGQEGELNDVNSDIHQTATADRLILHTLAMINRLTKFDSHTDDLDAEIRILQNKSNLITLLTFLHAT